MGQVPGYGNVIELSCFDIGHQIGEHRRTVYEPATTTPGQVSEHTFVAQLSPIDALEGGEVRIRELCDAEE